MAKKNDPPIETAPTLPPVASEELKAPPAAPEGASGDVPPDVRDESTPGSDPDASRPARCEECAGLLVLGTQKAMIGRDRPHEVDVPALICAECGRPSGTQETDETVDRLQAEALAEEALATASLVDAVRAHAASPPLERMQTVEPQPMHVVRYYRVTQKSRFYAPGQIAELAEGSVVSTLTHSIDALCAQGVPLAECGAPQVVDSPFSPQGYILAQTHDFSMEEQVVTDFGSGGAQ